MNEESIVIEPLTGGTARRPKEVLEVDCAWSFESAPSTLAARLFWYTAGEGRQNVRVVGTQSASPRVRGTQRFKFELPHGPYSFAGQLITLHWAIEFVADDDRCARWEFTMTPDGQEIRLAESD